MAIHFNSKFQLLADIPAYLTFTEDNRVLIGESAIQHNNKYETSSSLNTVFDVKRFLGHSTKSTKSDVKFLPYSIVNDDDSKLAVKMNINGRDILLAPEHLLSKILKKALTQVQKDFDEPIASACVSVSAQFDHAITDAIKSTLNMTGLKLDCMISDTSAALIGYTQAAATNIYTKPTNFLVVDLGSGTFKASLIRMYDATFEVLATKSHQNLGGIDFDNRIIEYLIQKVSTLHGKSIALNKTAIYKLRNEVEKAKIILSTHYKANIKIESLYENINLNTILTRDKFNELNLDLFRTVIQMSKNAIEESHLNKKNIDKILFVGGSMAIPLLRQMFKEIPVDEVYVKETNNLVVFGAALRAAHENGQYKSEKSFSYDERVFTAMLGIIILFFVYMIYKLFYKLGLPTEPRNEYRTEPRNEPRIEPDIDSQVHNDPFFSRNINIAVKHSFLLTYISIKKCNNYK